MLKLLTNTRQDVNGVILSRDTKMPGCDDSDRNGGDHKRR